MMFFDHWLADTIARGVILSLIALAWLMVLIRLNGLRALSKMTNFDFVMTIALGSLLAGAGQASQWNSVWQIFAAMAALFVAQYAAATLRKSSDRVEDTIGNSPCLLMRDGQFDEDALKANRVTQSDLKAKLREANVLSLDQVRAVVLETTGDVSVLHGDALDWTLCEGVQGAPKA
ncbi:DUF421 domain-containing protein [Erythrobacter sp. HA6-11]